MGQRIVKTVIITGASSGLGAALAQEYAAHGIVLGLIARDAKRLSAVARLCEAKGATTVIAALDVTQENQMAKWLRQFDAQYPVDLVIANAGISAGTGGGGESLAQVKDIMAVNIEGVLNTIHPVIDLMKPRGHGQIAIISSIAGFRGSPTAPAYSMSKAAVRIYGQALRGMLAPLGIAVSVICPGFIKTPMTEVNNFPMPFLLKADHAARIVKIGLLKNKALIAFPWPMFLLARMQNLLPDNVINKLYQKLPAKPAG